MNAAKIEVGKEYVFRPPGGQEIRVRALESPTMTRGPSLDDETWFCQVRILGDPLNPPDRRIPVSQVHPN